MQSGFGKRSMRRNIAIVFLLVLFILAGCSITDEITPMYDEALTSSESLSSVAPSNEEIHAESEDFLEYLLYHTVGETDVLIGSFTFPDDLLYYRDNGGRVQVTHLTTFADENDTFIGVGIDNGMVGLGRLFRLNLDTAELTGYEAIVPIWPLRDAIVADGYIYPKRNRLQINPNEISYTYYALKSLDEITVKFDIDNDTGYLNHDNILEWRRNPDNGDWYVYFQVARYSGRMPENNFEAYYEIDLYCAVFDSNSNIKHTNNTTLTWPIGHGWYEPPCGGFIVWEDKIYFGYVNKWHSDGFSVDAEEISVIEYCPYSNDVRMIASYPSEQRRITVISIDEGILTFHLGSDSDTWEKRQISIADGEELIMPIAITRPRFPLIFVGYSRDGAEKLELTAYALPL